MTKPGLSDEEKALFRQAMRGVVPLKGKKTSAPPEQTASTSPVQTKSTKPSQPREPYYLSDHCSEEVYADTVLSYTNPSFPRKRFQDLKLGKIPWKARLDLHGLHLDKARTALCDFIEQKKHTNTRCLLIIHGKGSPYGEPPILKNHVNSWLRQLDDILAFHSALARDGGAGALYVLLRKQKFIT